MSTLSKEENIWYNAQLQQRESDEAEIAALKAKIERAKAILEDIEPHHIGIADQIDVALHALL